MFENQQKDVEILMKSDVEFRSLYQRHKELDGKVRDAELGVLPMDDHVAQHEERKALGQGQAHLHVGAVPNYRALIS